MNETDTIAFTIDDDGKVLELIMSNADGIFIREDGKWVEVNTAQEQPTVDDQEWLEVSQTAVDFWDGLTEDERDLDRASVVEYAAPGE